MPARRGMSRASLSSLSNFRLCVTKAAPGKAVAALRAPSLQRLTPLSFLSGIVLMSIFGHGISSLFAVVQEENKGRAKAAPSPALPLRGSIFKGGFGSRLKLPCISEGKLRWE